MAFCRACLPPCGCLKWDPNTQVSGLPLPRLPREHHSLHGRYKWLWLLNLPWLGSCQRIRVVKEGGVWLLYSEVGGEGLGSILGSLSCPFAHQAWAQPPHGPSIRRLGALSRQGRRALSWQARPGIPGLPG